MSDFALWQWIGLAVAALLIGLSRGGVAGLGILVAAVAANCIPAKAATGFVLPLLIVGDLVALKMFRGHFDRSHLLRLFPWTIAGLLIGWFTMGRIDDTQARMLIGALIVAMVAGHVDSKRRGREAGDEMRPAPTWLAPLAGLLAGFTTLVANAAGPVMIVYLLAMRVPKLQFLGTSARFFLLLNLVKIPFMVQLGLVDGSSLASNALLVPLVLLGALIGRWLVHRIDQRRFELIAVVLTFVAGVKLLVGEPVSHSLGHGYPQRPRALEG